MSLVPIARGAVVGFSIAAPVGPIGILCIRRSLSGGFASGFAAGMGAATADAAYGCVAAFGLTSISNLLYRYQGPMRLIGGVFMCYLGARTLLSRSAPGDGAVARRGLAAVYGATLLLTLANPATILSFAMIFAALGLAGPATYTGAAQLVSGVFAGSALWWLLLSGGVGLVRNRLKPGWIRAVNGVSGCILIAFGIIALSKL